MGTINVPKKNKSHVCFVLCCKESVCQITRKKFVPQTGRNDESNDADIAVKLVPDSPCLLKTLATISVTLKVEGGIQRKSLRFTSASKSVLKTELS